MLVAASSIFDYASSYEEGSETKTVPFWRHY